MTTEVQATATEMEAEEKPFVFDLSNYADLQKKVKCVTCNNFAPATDENGQCEICSTNFPNNTHRMTKEEIAAEIAKDEEDDENEKRTGASPTPVPSTPRPGRKFDDGKPDWSLLPFDSVEEVVKVLTHGAEKYERDNWRHIPNADNRYFAAAMRHLSAYRRGERLDPESNLPHLAHAVCCLIFMMELRVHRDI